MIDAGRAVTLAAVALESPRCFAIARRAIGRHGAVQRTSELARALTRVRDLEPRTIVEIGSHTGGTLHAWGSVAAGGALLVSVDVRPLGWSETDTQPWRVIAITGDSRDAETIERVRHATGGSVDFLFIDGDHRYEGVRADFLNYAPLVRPGGLVALHDIVRQPGRTDCDVWQFWSELRAATPNAIEIVDPHGRQHGGMGIGLIAVTEEHVRRWTYRAS